MNSNQYQLSGAPGTHHRRGHSPPEWMTEYTERPTGMLRGDGKLYFPKMASTTRAVLHAFLESSLPRTHMKWQSLCSFLVNVGRHLWLLPNRCSGSVATCPPRLRWKRPCSSCSSLLGHLPLEPWHHALRKPKPLREATWSYSGWQPQLRFKARASTNHHICEWGSLKGL